MFDQGRTRQSFGLILCLWPIIVGSIVGLWPLFNCSLNNIATSFRALRMSTSSDPIEPTAVRFDDVTMWVELIDGRVLGVPLAWFPRLLHASPEQRADFELSYSGIHWDALDEDISTAGLLAGQADMTRPPRVAA